MIEIVTPQERMRQEETVRERFDDAGCRWRKVYFGGGSHMRNWLDQIEEICGSDNVGIEEVDSTAFRCYEESGEKMYRIWVRQRK